MSVTPAERRVLDAVKRCCERWGFAKVTVDDIAAEAGVSRATLYRLFPGGRDVIFEALRLSELEDFFGVLDAHLRDAVDLEDLITRAVVRSLVEMRADEHLALMLATEPGETLGNLTVAGLPRIIRVATVYLAPLLMPYVPDRELALRVVDLLVRLVISNFLAPSFHLDLADEATVRSFVRNFVMPALSEPALPDPTR